MSGATTAGELGIKIVIDSNAKEAFDNIKSGLKGVDSASEKTKKKLDMALGSNVKKLGGLLMGGITGAALAASGAVLGFGVASAHAFMESEQQVKSIAANFALLDKAGAPFEKIEKYAASTKDELEELGMAAGVSDDALVSVFNNIIERGNKSVEEAKKLTEQMAYAGRAVPGGAEALSEAFEAIQMGVIRAKNPIVGMIASTHTLKGTAKDVAKQMMKMTPEKQMELAEKAVERMSGKMEKVPMTARQAFTSMKVGWENIFEQAGEPMLAHLTPVIGKARELFLKIQPDLVDMADAFGRRVGEAFDIIIPIMDEVFTAFRSNSAEFKQAWAEISQPMGDLFHYIYENKGTFAKTFADVALAIAKVVAGLYQTISAAYRLVGAAAKFLGKKIPGGFGDFIADEDLAGKGKDARAAVKSSGVYGPSTDDRAKAKGAYLQAYGDRFGGDADKMMEGIKQFDTVWAGAMAEHRAVMDVATKNAETAKFGDTQSFLNAWNAASAAQDVGAEKYVSEFLKNNDTLVKVLAEKGPEMLGASYQTLIDTLNTMGAKGIADQIKKGSPVKLEASKGSVNQYFSGAINVKQDFREQDPDQIMVMMKREFSRQGVNRIQPGVSGIYGF